MFQRIKLYLITLGRALIGKKPTDPTTQDGPDPKPPI